MGVHQGAHPHPKASRQPEAFFMGSNMTDVAPLIQKRSSPRR